MVVTGKRVRGVPLFTGLTDGPFRGEELQQRHLAGRVVCFALTSLGKLIAPLSTSDACTLAVSRRRSLGATSDTALALNVDGKRRGTFTNRAQLWRLGPAL